MASTGIRELKNNLSQFVRRVEKGERIAVTAHGRVVAMLVPPSSETMSRRDQLIAEGKLIPARERGPLKIKWPDLKFPPGTAQKWIDEDREDRF
jgi:prevent-host-death family protein